MVLHSLYNISMLEHIIRVQHFSEWKKDLFLFKNNSKKKYQQLSCIRLELIMHIYYILQMTFKIFIFVFYKMKI